MTHTKTITCSGINEILGFVDYPSSRESGDDECNHRQQASQNDFCGGPGSTGKAAKHD